MRIEIICFGTELLLDKVNTNSNAIAEALSGFGYSVSQVTTVGDDPKDIVTALRDSLRRSSAVITCGGLGPTFDDLTRECAAKVLGRRLLYSKSIHERIRKRFQSVQLRMPEENKNQAYLIGGAQEIRNSFGTAPGQIVRWKNKSLILLPGPAKECLPMMNGSVLPYLKRRFGAPVSKRMVLHVYGCPESAVDELIQPVVRKKWGYAETQAVFGILAHRSIVDVKASVQGKNRAAVHKMFRRIRRALLDLLGDRVYGENNDTLESVVGRLLKSKRQTLALAESCTGGLIGSKITDVAGSSSYLIEGAVTYSNESKVRRLGVRQATLSRYGAVSAECAGEMARGIRRRAKSDWGLSATGIAGPGGGSAVKPVGTVYIGIASASGSITLQRNFFGTRTEIKEKSALCALDFLRRELLKR